MQISEHNFASTQPLNPLPGQQVEEGEILQSASSKRLQRFLYEAPSNGWQLGLRMLQLRVAFALFVPTVAGAVLGWWHTSQHQPTTVWLLLVSTFCTIVGMQLLHEERDYRYARQSNDIKFATNLFGTTYHLLAAQQIQLHSVQGVGYLFLLLSLIGHLGLLFLVGWPVLFFYSLSLLLMYSYSAAPIRYGYQGWGLGELGVFLGYGFLPLVGSYFIQSHAISWLPIWVGIPFGLLTVLVFYNYNFIHYRRDWLMRKRTLVVALGPLRAFDMSALLNLTIYVLLLLIASLAHLPLSTIVTLAVLPLVLGLASRLRDEQPYLEDLFRLHFTTLNATIWTGMLFCAALLANKIFS